MYISNLHFNNLLTEKMIYIIVLHGMMLLMIHETSMLKNNGLRLK